MSDKIELTDREKMIAEYIFYQLAPYIEKLQYRLEALEQKLPPRVQLIESLELLNKGTVVVDFFAQYCIPCYELMPVLERLAGEFNDRGVKFYRVDIEKIRDAVKIFDISAIPLVLVLRDGKVIQRMEGVPREKKEDIIRWMILRTFVPDDEWMRTYKFAERTAKAFGWRLNPNKVIREGLISALTYNRIKYGARYCPCKAEKVVENICPCKPYKNYPGSVEKIKRDGICYCGLYVSEEYYQKYMEAHG